MSPIINKKNDHFQIPSKYVLAALTFLCTLLMLITFGTSAFDKPLNSVLGYILVPFEKGISNAGNWLYNRSEELAQIKTLLEENEELKRQVAALTEENTMLQQEKYELNNLRKLLELDAQYTEYHKVGARVISRNPGNWYSSFLIDKGADDGIAADMNVIAGGGLVGRVSEVGPNWARVTSIISDNANVSAMTLATEDHLIVSGSLKLMENDLVSFSQLVDSKNQVGEGDKVVTSDISDKYLPNILIGYIHTINLDANNLTKSGYITPVVDFEHIGEVLVITELKQQIKEN